MRLAKESFCGKRQKELIQGDRQQRVKPATCKPLAAHPSTKEYKRKEEMRETSMILENSKKRRRYMCKRLLGLPANFAMQGLDLQNDLQRDMNTT